VTGNPESVSSPNELRGFVADSPTDLEVQRRPGTRVRTRLRSPAGKVLKCGPNRDEPGPSRPEQPKPGGDLRRGITV